MGMGESCEFHASVLRSFSSALTWSVDGLPGGNADTWNDHFRRSLHGSLFSLGSLAHTITARLVENSHWVRIALWW